MRYFYITQAVPHLPELEVNDVGVSQNEDMNSGVYKVKFLRSGIELTIRTAYIEEFIIQETGDKFTHKICDRCFKRLDTNEWFENNRHKKGNLITKRPSCRACRKVKNGRSITLKERSEWVSGKVKDYSAFTCPICQKTTIAGITKVVLDHNHKTGAVRGWLCESCNTGIGRFDDDPDIVKRALDWLQNN